MRTNAENLWKRRNRQKQRKSIEKTTENQQKTTGNQRKANENKRNPSNINGMIARKKSAFAGLAVSRILGRGLMLILFRRIETIADVAHGADEMLVLAAQLGA